jgi:hypothetical protein
VIDEELVSPEAFSAAVRARASYLARHSLYPADTLRPYSKLTLLLGMELETAWQELRSRGLKGAYRWAVSPVDAYEEISESSRFRGAGSGNV